MRWAAELGPQVTKGIGTVQRRQPRRPWLVPDAQIPDVVVGVDPERARFGQLRALGLPARQLCLGRSRSLSIPPSTASHVPVVEPDFGEAK